MKTYLIAVLLVLSPIVDGAMAGVDPSLVLYLPFDEAEGDVAGDSSGNDNHGAFVGEPKWVNGRSGTALEFSGAENANHVEVADSPSLSPQEEITLMAWIFIDVWEPTGGVVSKYTGAGNQRSYNLHMDHDASLSFRSSVSSNGAYQVGTSTTNAVAPAETLVEGQWQHIAMTYKGGEFLRLYHDGNMVAESDATATPNLFDNTTPLMIGTDFAIGSAHNGQPREFTGVVDEVAVFSRQLSAVEIQKMMTGLADPALAAVENPDDGETDVALDVVLNWTPGEFAQTHNVYLGTSFDDVNDASLSDPKGVLVAEGRTDSSFAPGRLTFDQTYYWRVDEVNGAPDFTVFKGNVWSFTTEPLAYPVEAVLASSNGSSEAGAGPENIVNGSGLNENDEHSTEATDMWLAIPGADPLSLVFEFDKIYKLHEMLVWNYNVQFELVLGFGVKGVTAEYSSNGVDWAVLGDVELAQATATANYTANTAIDFGGVGAKFVRLTVNSGHGPMGQFGLSEVRFTFIPVQARAPHPADGATAVAVDATLAWRAGREAAAHEVYLDTVADAPALVDTVTAGRYTPTDLQFGTTYYWRIDEVNEAEAVSVWPSELWSFSTFEYAVIDDMESYDDEENRIYDTWLDGFVNDTGSTVGYFEAPFAEKTIVNSGRQSMPLEYANDAAPFYSEAELDLGSMDLDTNGADTVRLFVSGQAPAFLETADGSILMNAIGNDIWNQADQFRYAYRTLTGDGSMTVRVDAIDGAPHGWVKGGVMIRQSVEPGSVNAFTAITGGSGDGATFQWRPEADGSSSSSRTLTGIAPPYYARIVRQGNTFTGYLSADGENWEQQGDSSIDVAMTDPVLIGLALTSHNVDQATSAEFADVSFTGHVGASWEVAEIGAAQPVGNVPAPLYVALEDSSGNVAVATHPDASIAGRSGWNEWLIPYSDLAGVNLSRVAVMYIGLGDRDNPTAGGNGMIFVDDVGYGRPAPVAE